jgi:hypothetical protein
MLEWIFTMNFNTSSLQGQLKRGCYDLDRVSRLHLNFKHLERPFERRSNDFIYADARSPLTNSRYVKIYYGVRH